MSRERFTLALRSARLRSPAVSTAPSSSKARPRVATYYARLKVAQDAPPEVIRAAHRALVQKYHPDRHGGSLRHEQVVAALNRAQDILLDRESRAAHDQWIRDEEVRLGLREPPVDEDQLHPVRAWFARLRERYAPRPADDDLGWMGVGPPPRSRLRRYGVAITLMAIAFGAGAAAMVFSAHNDIHSLVAREAQRVRVSLPGAASSPSPTR